jgi:long-chain acyl-CoA synthetase
MSQYPWMASYPDGVPWNAELPQGDARELLDEAVQQWPDGPAIDFMGRKLSYQQLSKLVDQAAAGFQKLGVQPGVHVGLYLPNTPQYVISFFGVLRAGGTVVNYSPLDAASVLTHKVEDSVTDVLITLDLAALYANIRPLLENSRLKWLVVGTVGDFSANPTAVNDRLAASGATASSLAHAQQISFLDMLENDGQHLAWPVENPTKALAVLQYTGGTTGLPKGAMLTHANLTAATEQVRLFASMNGEFLQNGCERTLVVLPMFHIYAMVVNMLLSVRIGAEMVLCIRFEPGAVLQDIERHRITFFPGVPTMFTALVAHPDIEKHDLRSLRACSAAGAPPPVELLKRFEQLTGCILTEGWGMTETTSMGTLSPAIGFRKQGSCGMPAPGVTLRFLDLDDPARDVPRGSRGEIAIKGFNVMQGYWNQPKATTESFTADGYFRTGDVAFMDEDGFVFIVDRTKDMLICGGFNVYPRVIEEAIYEYPQVEEVLVLGIDDEYRGQTPKAFVKLRDGADPLTLDVLKEFLKSRLGKHEMISAMELRNDLPKTAVGKLSKNMLKDQISSEALDKSKWSPS